jgi:CRP/FNR family transcriptional regulator
MQAAIAIRPHFDSAPAKFQASCATCSVREMCLPGGLDLDELRRIERIVYARKRLKRGEGLFNAGDEFSAVYAIRSGFFKTTLPDGEGREQVTGFFMNGDLMGMDGLVKGRHNGTAIALEDSEVCILPYALIEEIGREIPALQRRLHAVLAAEIVREQGVMLLLGSMRSWERLAAFLLNLSKRLLGRGFSASDFHLRMSREEIGSYLGLTLETVSRLFSQFQNTGLIDVRHRRIRILDIHGLERALSSNKPSRSAPPRLAFASVT